MAASPPPWNSWSLDEQFFGSLCRWTVQNPGNSLTQVLDNITNGIDTTKDLRNLIPDAPFPARSLVEALLSLLKLGISISKAKQAVYDFAKDVVRWVDQQVMAFRDGEAHRFTKKTWDHLEPMRTLIDEICKWAYNRLEDGRWKRLTHGLSVSKEIDEFKARINESRAQFLHLSVINISQGQDAIVQDIQSTLMTILDRQKEQHDYLTASLRREFAAKKLADEKWQFLASTLSSRAIDRVSYVDQNKRPCAPDTRVEILEEIKKWSRDVLDDSQRLLWLIGIPGAGKSAITASFARDLNDAGCLWAQFFINRNDARTLKPASIFPSIALQLSNHCHSVADHLHGTLITKRSLVDDISDEQAQKLFVEAIAIASSLSPSQPIIVVLDALDESDAAQLRLTAKVVVKAALGLPHNAKLFVSSRAEDAISAAFATKHIKHIDLDTSASSSIRDVNQFLKNGVQAIVQDYDLDDHWPGNSRLQTLFSQASGLFIWAQTAIEFIRGQIDLMGEECLDNVINQLTAAGMNNINQLYNGILRAAYTGQMENTWVMGTFRRITGAILLMQEPLCISALAKQLDLHNQESAAPVDLKRFVRRLRTVLVVGPEVTIDANTVPRLHKSFFEFITGEHADSCFRINESLESTELALACFRVMKSELRFDICQLETSHLRNDEFPNLASRIQQNISKHLSYSCRFWSNHLQDATSEERVLAEVRDFLYSRILYWLEVLSLIKEVPTAVGSLVSAAQWVQEIDVALSALASDASRFVINFREPISISAPHIYLSALPFAPSSSKLAKHFLPQYLNTVSLPTGRQTHWPAIINILDGHTSSVSSVAFSPDGKYVVSGSWDSTIRVWDAEKGNTVSGPFEGHTSSVSSVAFSPDGKYVVSGSRDSTIRVWDAEKGNTVSGPFEGHTDSVESVAFSPDGKYVVSGSWDSTIRVWDAEKGNTVSGPFEGHTDGILSVIFSPDGKYIVSGSWDSTIRVWDAEKGNTVSGPFEGHTDSVESVAFSPDGKYVVSGSRDNALRVWDAETHKTPPTLLGSPTCPASIAFPPGQYIVDAQVLTTKALLPSDSAFLGSVMESSKLIDGWMCGVNSALLFWVPPQNQAGLFRPRNTAIMGTPATVLDLSKFAHGSSWKKCRILESIL